ncbi:MAG: biotin/lipoyl-binding protein, partial [Candidatus Magasanikbacteria bacterium]|nr:biotin/lipoyl-binding protein [Candidatus Magasanikbacteria bacterium]
MVHQILNAIKQRKITSAFVILILLGGWYYGYKKITTPLAENHYVLAAVQKGALVTSVSGTGQIAVSNQVDVKSKASGDIIAVSAADGQAVKAGAVLARLDAKDAQKAVRDAQANLESAKLTLEKLQQAADPLSLIQAENSLVQANDSKQNSQDALKKAYDDGFNTVANAFIDIPAIMTGVHDILYGYNLSATQNNADYYVNAVTSYNDKIWAFRDAAIVQYGVAKIKYDQSFANYKSVTRLSDTDTLETLVSETYTTAQSAAETVKSITNFIQLYEDALVGRNLKPIATADTQLSTLNGYTGKFNSHLANLLTIKNTIANSKTAIASADRTIAERTESLAKLKAGADPLDIQSQQLSVKQRANALLDVQEKLADYNVRAPFDGVAAKVNIKKG